MDDIDTLIISEKDCPILDIDKNENTDGELWISMYGGNYILDISCNKIKVRRYNNNDDNEDILFESDDNEHVYIDDTRIDILADGGNPVIIYIDINFKAFDVMTTKAYASVLKLVQQ